MLAVGLVLAFSVIVLGLLVWLAYKGDPGTIKLTDEQAKRLQKALETLLEREDKDVDLDGEG